MYKLLPETQNGPASCILRIADVTYIPIDNTNTDYQEYLKWLAEGNTPEPADGEQA